MFKRKCKITFIAHGSTIYSEDNRFVDKLDYPPINENGEEEICKITEFIKKRGLKTNKIYASPALCCTQSAEIIADELKQDFEILPEFTNRKWGTWSGLTFNEVKKKFPQDNIPVCCPENGEEIGNFNKRVKEVISKVIEENLRGRVIIVTHPTVIQAAIGNALGIPVDNQYKAYIRPASATQISYFTDWASLVYSGHVPI
ncbi:histidine phosphatase family protein [bacterium]|nr:histidine phosphatase family protein [bacterium]